MTKEEALQILDTIPTIDEQVDTLGMAVHALSQEPTDTWSIKDVADAFERHGLMKEQEPCDDAVSREAVLDILQYAWEANKDIQESIVEIKALPSVTQKSGKWLMTGEVDVYYDLPSYKCSKCGQPSLENGDYCPNCGAKMVEPQESEEQTE